MSAGKAQLARESVPAILPKGRSPLAYLLHALNQPLTGLHCSLEVALASPRTAEQYDRTLRDGLELAGRMRTLVEAIRELAETEQEDAATAGEEIVPLEALLREVLSDLRPVAQARGVRLRVTGDGMLPVQTSRARLAEVLFRFLDSALSLAAWNSIFRIDAKSEGQEACLAVSWSKTRETPEHSPFSRQELGLLIAQAGWKRAGARWESESGEQVQTVRIRLPLAHDPTRG